MRIGIVGCGGIAEGKHLPSLAKIKGVEIIAFCDIIPERAQKMAAKFGTADALVLTDYLELVQMDLDAVHVCTPNSSHAPISIAALDHGKHVLCEKPMAMNYAEALCMCEAAKRNKKALTIGYQSRFMNQSQYLKKLIDNGELGEIYYARAPHIRVRGVPTWGVFLDEEKQGGGPLIDVGTHSLDLTLWLMNNYKPKTVLGSVYRKLADTKDAANIWGPWDPQKYTVEDSAFGMITFENGACINLEASWAINMTDHVDHAICGTKGGADWNWEGMRLNGEKYSRLFETKIDFKTGGVAFFEGTNSDDMCLAEAQCFINHIRGEGDLVTLPEQAAVVTRILQAIYESGKSGKPVVFEG